jgi:hypothetical protein
MSTLPSLDKVDRTKPFTDAQYEELRTLSPETWRAYMARPNAREHMSQKDIEKHYKSQNYPPVKYGPGGGSPNPPQMRGIK